MRAGSIATSILCAVLVGSLATACSDSSHRSLLYVPPLGIHKIRHVIVIMQENRSFDSYFGTYPGADGIPMKHGVPTVCLPDRRSRCRASARSPTTTT